MDQKALDKLKAVATEGAAEVLHEMLGASREDVLQIAERVVDAGLQATIEGDPMAGQIVREQLRALANVTRIRANRALLDQAAAVVTIVLTTVVQAALSAL